MAGTAPAALDACLFPGAQPAALVWLTRRKRRHFFRLYQGRRQVALSLWWEKDGFHVGDEGSARQRFLPHGAFQDSFLARAIAEGRLYVLWDV